MVELSAMYDSLISGNTKVGVDRQIDEFLNPKKYQKPEKNTADLTKVNQLIADAFGADFSDPDFAEFLSTQAANGVTPYELTQMIQQDPRYLKKQQDAEKATMTAEATAARDALSQSLVGQEDAAFDRTKSSIMGSFMGAGRLNSSGLDAALARARENLQRDRQAFLGNIAYDDSVRQQGYKRDDFMGRQQQGYQNFLRQNEPMYQQRFNVQDTSNYAKFKRPYEMEDYNLQRNDYFSGLDRQRKMQREAAIYGLAGNVLGAGATIGLGKWAGAFR